MNLLRSMQAAAAMAVITHAFLHCQPAVAQAPKKPLASGVDRQLIDPSVRVQDDLYRHANGKWLASAKFPADKARIGSLDQIVDKTQEHLRALIENAQRHADGPEAARVGDLYASFMNEAAIEKAGLRPLAPELAAIDAVSDQKQLAALFPRLNRLGVDVPLTMEVGVDDRDSTRYVPSIYQSGLGLPDRDYYLKADDATFKTVREKYVEFLAALLSLSTSAKTAQETAKESAQSILALETDIAKIQWTQVENRDPVKLYNLTDLADLPKLAPGLDWDAYLTSARIAGKTPNVIVNQPSYFKGLTSLIDSVPLATWKAYARSHLLMAYAPYLGKDYVDARFAFVGKVLNGLEQNRPRWKRGVTAVDQYIGEGLGKLYVDKYFPPASKARMDELVANLLEAYRQSIGSLDWMGTDTKKAALAKLAKFNAKIAYPKRWIDYSTLVIRRDDLAGNVMRAHEFEAARTLARLGKPVDRDEWFMTPQTVNAYYNPSLNEIVFPAAFLQAPNFNPLADDAVNYGAVGMVIGHEISHGFDDQGSQYDGDGNLRNWWTDEDRTRFSAKTKLLIDQYSALEAVPGYNINGELTLGENIADNSGLAIAYKAYHLSLKGKTAPVIGGMTGDERFFYGFAQTWRAKTRDAALLAQIKSDHHAPDDARVDGASRNHPAFYSTFDVKPGDKMYLPPDQRVNMW